MTSPSTGPEAHLPPELSDVLDQGLALVCIHDAEGVVTWANESAERLLGRRWARAVGRSLAELAADREGVRSYLEAAGHGGVVTTRLDLVGPDGRTRALQVKGRRLPGRSGGATLLVGQAVDSLIEDVERDLREEKRLADRANRAKSEFLAQMTREIRTPMNGIIGMTDLALSTTPTDQQREYLRMVRSSAASLLETIDRVLDLSELDASAIRLEQTDFILWDVVSGAFEPFAPLAWDKGVELLYDEAPGVPEFLRGDPVRLRQALRNLMGDAVKLTPSGSVRLSVDVATKAEASTRLRFEVADTGIGTPPETVGSSFASLRQADGITTGRFAGTGLRLAVTTGLVRVMGGELTVASTPGRGRTFSFALPFDDVRVRPARRELPGSLAGRRALVVDDHNDQRAILADLTGRLGIDVSEAASGKEALPMLADALRAQRGFDIVLLGCHLHGPDGFGLVQRILEDPRFANVVVMAVTSGGRPGDGTRCRDIGIAAYLPKPVAPRELRDALLLSVSTRSPARSGGLVTRYALRAARQGLRVLLVEGNPVTRRLATGALEGLGHEVRHASTGAEALDVLGSEAFDVILLDLGMPDMDGVAVAGEIRRLEAESPSNRRTPIVAMTARATVGDRERVVAAGMDDYVSKPIRDDRLSEVLRQTTGHPPGSHPAAHSARAGRRGARRAPLYDRVVLLERLESDIDLLRSLTSVFGADSADLLARIEGALADDEAETLERAAHTLKGAVSIFGAEKARERASLLERLAREHRVAEARGEYGPLRDLVTGLTQDLTALVEELERSPPPVREAP